MAEIDWRTKCIEEFKLEPVPVTWSDQVARGSEKAWKQYYEYRDKQAKSSGKKGSNDDGDDDEDKAKSSRKKGSDEDECYNDEDEDLLQFWESLLEALESEIFPDQEGNPERQGKWQTHRRVEDVEYEMFGGDDIISAEFHGHAYSPFALPHAIHLHHSYLRVPQWNSMAFDVSWGYKLLDFEESRDTGFTTLCSNCYEDAELRADVIDVSHFNQNTVDRLRRFLFGAVEESKQVCCDDYSFLRLLFGTMGTFSDEGEDYATIGSGWIGYEWYPGRKLQQTMIKEGAHIGDPEDFDYGGINWLEHRIREVAGTLRPMDTYYEAPTIRDAPGYRYPDSDSS
jgi:hypothetical protein